MASCLRLAVAVVVVAVLTLKSQSQNITTGQCCGNCVTGPQGPPGIPGNNGIPGNSGVPGNHGFPGHDGAKGDRGELGPPGGNGAKGDRGDLGPPGGNGAKGDRGELGPPGGNGAKGDRGDLGPPGGAGAKGDRGDQGPPGIHVSAPRNVKQCTWDNLFSAAGSGAIVECPFNKLSSTSALRVTWNGALRVWNEVTRTAVCKRWFFTLNGAECSDPAPIDGIMFMFDPNNHPNNHRVSTIDGLCYGLPAGNMTVTLNIGTCAADGLPEGSASTGYNSYSRIIVEELDI
ncbi:collagen triple helix repeat-containing protein 1-like [Branchiostoma floridae]|uniref:Collagen triple helix repeat-containing protein 1-like n=1 Tax=Branchiostoma floridae TaxID=7739 RepID=C3YE26_BRAFL|nr:collagen triple helix repeat-containing protein 1-like [Branchiostoma floridae]|eukprot:XP_002605324.1 hypothetical protein BRAFLDRAFT_89033 [Branchiostoma floridae]